MGADKKSKILVALLIILLIVLIVVAGVHLGHSWEFLLIFGVLILGTCSVLAWIIIRSCCTATVQSITPEGQERELQPTCSFFRKVGGVPKKFPYKELEKATDSFNSLLGRGASGSVFKGILSDGSCVAVKRIENVEHGEREFKSEVAAIACAQHINLVHLYGYCIVPSGPRFLVYEHIHYGSLDSWIFPRRDTRNRRGGCLPWHLRYKVAIDVAKALSYLHHDCRSRILHLDVKPENILLDESYRAVVADFGVSKLMNRDESKILTRMRGTRGYLAPEWILEDGISEKCDVYSYGIVLLEMIGGRRIMRQIDTGEGRSSKRKWDYFPKIVVDKVKQGRLMEVVDQRIVANGRADEHEIKRVTFIALWCIQEDPRLRPNMARVIQMLEERSPVDDPPETRMLMVHMLEAGPERPDRRHLLLRIPGLSISDSDTNYLPSSSVNSIGTLTVLTGR